MKALGKFKSCIEMDDEDRVVQKADSAKGEETLEPEMFPGEA